MPWFAVDDGFHSHQKVERLRENPRVCGNAIAVWTLAGSYCADQLTDGFVSKKVVRRLVPFDPEKAVQALIDVGLWQSVPGGYLFKDWPHYQLTRGEVLAKRRLARERTASWRSAKGQPDGQPTELPSIKSSSLANCNALRNGSVTHVVTQPVTLTPTHPIPFPPLKEIKKLKDSVGVSRDTKPNTDIQAVFEHWRDRTGHKHAKLTEDKRRRLRARLSEGWTVAELKLAVDGMLMDPWHVDGGKLGFEFAFRNSDKVERFIALAQQGSPEERKAQREKQISDLQWQMKVAEKANDWETHEKKRQELEALRAGARTGAHAQHAS